MEPLDDKTTGATLRWRAVVLGPAAAVATYMLARFDPTLSQTGAATAAIAAWMALWWVTEAVPLPVTSLVPLVAFPLVGVAPLSEVATAYADKNIFLFMGGFFLALAIERWRLHRRLALWTVAHVGTSPARLVAGVMAVTAGLSMWMSNTATAAMMLPIGMSLVQLTQQPSGNMVTSGRQATTLAKCLMLGIAYAASIGGMGTLVGTPTNLLLAGFAQRSGINIGFAQWMAFAVPFMVVYLLLAWWFLTHKFFGLSQTVLVTGRDWVRHELRAMGPMSAGEKVSLAVFTAVAVAWLVRGPLSSWNWFSQRWPFIERIDDSLIAMAGALSLFVLPVNRVGHPVLTWNDAGRLPWGILLLFGGGFSLAAAIQSSQLDGWISQRLALLDGCPTWVLAVAVTAVVLAATELTSNTPTLATFLPVVAGLASAVQAPELLLLIPATLAASCAFMLPVATPPNAIVFGSGHLNIRDMVRAGCVMNVFGLVLIPLYVLWVVPWIFP